MSKEETVADVSKTVQFALEIEELKGVLRKVRPIWEERYENTAEHGWQIALFALSMASALDLTIDVTRAVTMLLVHDLGEVDAGDKFVFAPDGWEERRAAELRALERICGPRRRAISFSVFGKSLTRENRPTLEEISRVRTAPPAINCLFRTSTASSANVVRKWKSRLKFLGKDIHGRDVGVRDK